MNCQVNLTARSICRSELEPEKLMEVQRDLLGGGAENGAIPLLQAVVVCLKVSANSTTNTVNIPKPTCIRQKPNSFGNLGSFFYLNPLLFAKLDIKLKEFLAIRKKLNLPYEKIIKSVSIGKSHERSMLEPSPKVTRAGRQKPVGFWRPLRFKKIFISPERSVSGAEASRACARKFLRFRVQRTNK